MHIFVYEWATGGGLVDELGALPDSMIREGAAMLCSLVADLSRLTDCRVSALRDMRVLDLALPGCNVVDVHSKVVHDEQFDELCRTTDATLLIAPEFDGLLSSAARDAMVAGATLLSPSAIFVRTTGDKQQTAELLETAGVRVPDAVVLEPDEKLPEDVDYPAVLKPIDGAGSQDTQLVAGPFDEPLPYHLPRRLERFCAGMPASVAVLCGPTEKLALPPCKQKISSDGRLRYQGGQLPLPDGMAERATNLALRGLGALPAAHGYVGVDLVLGRDPDGTEDFLLEVNPRLTTSYVGLSALAKTNLAETMLRICSGNDFRLEFGSQQLQFDCEGNVSYL